MYGENIKEVALTNVSRAPITIKKGTVVAEFHTRAQHDLVLCSNFVEKCGESENISRNMNNNKDTHARNANTHEKINSIYPTDTTSNSSNSS